MRIAPTFGWVVSMSPQVMAEAGDPNAMSPITARTPKTSKTRRRTNLIATTTTPSERMVGKHHKLWPGRRSLEPSLERPVIPFPQQVAQEVGRLPAIDLHQEGPQVFAHEPTGRPVRLEVDAIVLDSFLLAVDSHRVIFDSPGQERVRLLIHGDHGRVDRLRGRKAVRPQEDRQEFFEGHLVDVLVHWHVRLDRARLVLDLAAFDLDRDAEPLERLVDLLVHVRLLLWRVLRAVPRFVEVSSRGPRVERRVHRILPVRRIAVLLRVLGIALGRAEPAVSFPGRLHGADHRGSKEVRSDKDSSGLPAQRSAGLVGGTTWVIAPRLSTKAMVNMFPVNPGVW